MLDLDSKRPLALEWTPDVCMAQPGRDYLVVIVDESQSIKDARPGLELEQSSNELIW